MSPRSSFFAIVIAVVVLVCQPWRWMSSTSAPPQATEQPAPPVPEPSVPKTIPGPKRPQVDLNRSPLADALNAENHSIKDDLAVVQDLCSHYRTIFGANPTGTNAEITRTLSGRNKRFYAPLPFDHAAINLRGELTDRWKTPFFFHNLSAEFIEIRSAGPDRTFWTPDDATLSNAPPAS